MLTFSKLEKKGNLGNQLFHIASTVGLADRNNHKYTFPQWQYAKYFNFQFPEGKTTNNFIKLKEKQYSYYDWDIAPGNYDIEGWLQSEKYFNISLTRKIFTFKKEEFQRVIEKYNHLLKKDPILITVRRGDFIAHPLYYQLSYKFYLLALIYFFPDWKERNIIFTSDDISYCKYHFRTLPNSYFIEALTPIEQLFLGSKCNDFIISNSTFSWWMAWLGEDSKTKVVRPFHNFSKKTRKNVNEKDYYPPRWIEFNHHFKLIPLRFYKIILKGEFFLLRKFIMDKVRGAKYRLQTLLKKINPIFFRINRYN